MTQADQPLRLRTPSPADAADGTILALTLEPGPDAKTPTMPIISKGVATAPG